MGGELLARREFIKLSAILAAGAVLPVLPGDDALCMVSPVEHGHSPKSVFHFRGHKKSGCAFHPELTDIWAGGGAELPECI